MNQVQCLSEKDHLYKPVFQTNSGQEDVISWNQCLKCGKIREDVNLVDEINCYYKLLHIYKKTYKSRGIYGRWCKSGYNKFHDYFSGHMNFNWEILGLVPESELHTKKIFEL